MPRTKVKEENIFYVDLSSNNPGPAVVMIHGIGGTHRHWVWQLQASERGRRIALDLPGHGFSSGKGRESITSYADFIIDFLNSLATNRVVVAGHSMGGAIALELALRHAPQLAGLILVGTGARLRVKPEFLSGLAENFEETVHVLATWFYGPRASKDLLLRGEEELRSILPSLLLSDFQVCERFDVMERLGEISVPTLVICGDEDRLTPRKYSQYLRDQIPGAILLAVAGAGHVVMLEKPTAVAQGINDFLNTV